MPYALELSHAIIKKLRKLAKKDPRRALIVHKKAEELRKNLGHYKPLRAELFGVREAHIDSHFVLTFEIDEEHHAVILLDLEHHEKIFR